ncbi:MAG: hypothetical protein ABWZ02_07745 [Nakamurella sp.]
MTWAKLSDDFPDDCARADLSDAAFRTHAEGLCWAMRKEDGGRIRHLDLRRLAETADPGTAAVELVAKGFWSAAPGGWQIEHHMEYQPEPDLLVAKRSNNAARQRRKRRKDAGLDLDAPLPVSRRDDPRDDHRDDPSPPTWWSGSPPSGPPVTGYRSSPTG